MKKVLFWVALIVFSLPSGVALAGTYEIEVTRTYPYEVTEIATCEDRGGVCQITVNLSEGEKIDVEARFYEEGIINFMFLHNREYVRVGETDSTEFDFEVDRFFSKEKEVTLYRDPSNVEALDQSLGLTSTDKATSNEILANLGIVVKPIFDDIEPAGYGE